MTFCGAREAMLIIFLKDACSNAQIGYVKKHKLLMKNVINEHTSSILINHSIAASSKILSVYGFECSSCGTGTAIGK